MLLRSAGRCQHSSSYHPTLSKIRLGCVCLSRSVLHKVRYATVTAQDHRLKKNAASRVLMSNEELQQPEGFNWGANQLHFLTDKPKGFQSLSIPFIYNIQYAKIQHICGERTHWGSLSILSHKHLPAFVLQDERNGMFSDFLLILVHWLLVCFPIETLWKSQCQLLSLWWTHPGRYKESIISWWGLVRNLEGAFQLWITVWETQRQELSWSVSWSSNGLSHLLFF